MVLIGGGGGYGWWMMLFIDDGGVYICVDVIMDDGRWFCMWRLCMYGCEYVVVVDMNGGVYAVDVRLWLDGGAGFGWFV